MHTSRSYEFPVLPILFASGLTTVLVCGFIEAKTGSYTIDIMPGADPNSKIRVTAKSENGTTYDQEFTVGGQTSEQARNTIATDLASEGWVLENNGTNGITMTGNVGGDPNAPLNDMKQVDIGDNDAKINTKVDGNLTVAEAVPGDKNFKFAFFSPNAHSITPGTLLCNLNAISLSPALSPGDTPVQAAQRLHSALSAAGLVTTVAGAEITLDWANPTNAGILGNAVHVELGSVNSAGGPHVQLGLPPSAVTSTSIPTLPQWGIMALIFLLSVTGAYMLRKHQMRTTQ